MQLTSAKVAPQGAGEEEAEEAEARERPRKRRCRDDDDDDGAECFFAFLVEEVLEESRERL